MSDHPQPENLPAGGPRPDPTAPPPISGQPWETPTGEVSAGDATWAPDLPSYLPGSAPVPGAHRTDYPPTSAFPPVNPAPEPVNYAPPGYTPDYGQGAYGAANHPPYGAGFALPPGYGPPDQGGYPGGNYARSDYPGGYPPPAYGPPPGPPARRSNAPLIAVIVAVALLLCGGAATAGILTARTVADKVRVGVKPAAPGLPTTAPSLPTEGPDLPGVPPDSTDQAGQTITVTYEVRGDGPAEIIYLGKLDAGPTRVDDVSLPWKFTTTLQAPTLVSVIAMRIDPTADGQVTCRALVNGREVRKSTAHGTVATAACTYFALD